MDCRADVVNESRQGELGRARTAADGAFGFVDRDREAGLCQHDRGGQTIGTGAHDDGIERRAGHEWWDRLYHGNVPELPDVTVYVEALAARMIGRRIERVRVKSP